MATYNEYPGTSSTSVTVNQMADAVGTVVINPSGGTNDAPTITNAMNAAGRRIVLGAGTFNLRSTINMLYKGLTIEGAGTAATFLNIDDSAGNIGDGIFIDKVYGCRIKDLTVTAASTRTSGNGIHVRGGDITSKLTAAYNLADSDFHIENVDMTKQFTGIYVNNDTANYNWRGFIRGGRHSQVAASGHGIWIDTSGGTSSTFGASHFITDWWYGQDINTSNAAIRLSGTGDCTVTNTEVLGAVYGVLIDPAANGFLTSVTFNGCFIDGSATACMRIAPNASVARFGEIRFNGTWFAGSSNGNVIDITGAAAKLILFDNCTLYSAQGTPGWLAKIDASNGVRFNSCSFAGATTGGLWFTGNAAQFNVADCLFTASGVSTGATTLPIGIQIDAGCDRYSVTGNDLYDPSIGTKITNTPGTSANRRIVQDNVTA